MSGREGNGRVRVNTEEYLQRVFVAAQHTSALFDLSGKRALVVGGNKGIGQATALALAGAGADICVVGRGPTGLRETAEAVSKLGRRGESVAIDVTEEKNVITLVDKVLGLYDAIDILVNSQGAAHLQEIAEFETAKWDEVMGVNLRSVFLCCKHVGAHMLQRQEGRIINIASVRGFQGRAKDPAYAPSKAALIQLTRSMAIEWGTKGIRVNAIAPTFTVTPLSAPFFDDPAFKEFALSRIPMKRLGEVEDVMGTAIFLSSRASDFINGHTIPVDGGWLAA